MMHHHLLPALCACTAAITAQSPTWTNLDAAPDAEAATWDAARHRLVMTGPARAPLVWEWDGAELHQRPLATSPLGPLLLTYDPHNREVVAIADSSWGNQYSVGTWQGAGWDWRSSSGAPTVDASAAIAFDVHRRRLVLYRGMATGSTMHEWDGQQWWFVANGTGPTARTGVAFAYDPLGQRCILYGGDDGSGARADTWAWDGFSWTQIQAVSAPGARMQAALAFDPFRSALVLYGGDASATDSWQLAGATWTPIATAANPGPQRRARMFADDQGLLLLVGSQTQLMFGYDPFQPLWRLQGNTWNLVARFPMPTPRSNTAYAYDRVRQQFVSCGGSSYGSYSFLDQTVLFDRRWRHVAPAHQPLRRYSNQLCWSAANQRVLMFGGGSAQGELGDTWSWDGSDWQQHTPGQSPAPRRAFVMAEDPSGGVVLFGGQDATTYFDDTWKWDGATWQQQAVVQHPSARIVAVAALDSANHYVVMYGGYSPSGIYSETWLWDGAAWTQRHTTVVPNAISISSMAFRPQTGRLLLSGGVFAYEWTGADWSLQSFGFPGYTQWVRLATDPVHGQLFAFQAPSAWMLSSQRAAAARYGSGCSVGPAPVLDMVDAAALDRDFAVELIGLAPSAPAFAVFGLTAQSLPIGGGCALLVGTQVATSLLLTDGNGVARLPMTVPNVRSLRGLQFLAQGAVLDPARSTIGSVTLTAGLRVTIGD